MIRYETKKNRANANDTFYTLVVAMLLATIGIEQKTKNESTNYMLKHPVLAFWKFIKALGSAETTEERKALDKTLRAKGKEEGESNIAFETRIELALRSVKSTDANFRSQTEVLKRIHGVGKGKRITLSETQQKKAISLLKSAVSMTSDQHVDETGLDRVLVKMSEIFANAENSTITIESLAIEAPLPDGATAIPAKVEVATATK